MNEMEQLIKRFEALETELRDEVKTLKLEVKELDSKVVSQEKNTELIKKDIGYLIAGFDKLENSVTNSIKAFADSLKKLESKDGEMWNVTIKQIVTAVITAIVTYIAMYYGKKG